MEIIVTHLLDDKKATLEVDYLLDSDVVCEALGFAKDDYCDQGDDWDIEAVQDFPEQIREPKEHNMDHLIELQELLDDHSPELINLALDQLGGAAYNLSFLDGVAAWLGDHTHGIHESEKEFAREYLEDCDPDYQRLPDHLKYHFDLEGWFDDSGFCSEQVGEGLVIFSS